MSGIKHIRELMVDTIEQIERRSKKGQIAGIPTGFVDLDSHLDGLQPQLYVLGGRPSMGKSSILKDMILSAGLNGHHPHLINIEDGNCNTIKRILASMSNVELWKIRKGFMNREEWQSVINESSKLVDIDITFDDMVSSVEPITESIATAVRDYNADVIFIDYLQLIQADRNKGRKRTEEIGDITKALKQIAKPSGLNVPVIVCAQLNRYCELRENKRPVLIDLRESGDIEQDADVVMFLYREGYYTKNKDDKKAELIIAKGRNEGTGIIYLYWDDMRTRFLNWKES